MKVRIVANIDTARILASRGLGASNLARCFLASEVVRLSDPYVPFQQGTLKNSAQVSGDGSQIVYPGPYAHYQYTGKVMGPNIPIFKDGKLAGFYSRAPKYYTGKSIQYHGAPMRGPQWDKRMLADRHEDLERSLAGYIGGLTK